MSAIFNAVIPLFGLILLGYLSAHRKLLGVGAVDSLNKYVVWLALPALLFEAMSKITLEEISQAGFIAGFGLGIALTFFIAFALGFKRDTRLADASIECLAASYANTGFMGIPLCLMVLGPASLPPAIIATLLTACVLFAFSIVLIEIDVQGSGSVWRTVRKVALSLLRNPLVLAPLAGAVVAAVQLPLPVPLVQLTSLLGASASPCALVTIGLFLAQHHVAEKRAAVWRIVSLKMLLQPLITFVLVRWVFDMPPMWANVAVLLAALPIGTGPFMLAKLYNREPAVTSQAILFSTIVSLATLSILLALMELT